MFVCHATHRDGRTDQCSSALQAGHWATKGAGGVRHHWDADATGVVIPNAKQNAHRGHGDFGIDNDARSYCGTAQHNSAFRASC